MALLGSESLRTKSYRGQFTENVKDLNHIGSEISYKYDSDCKDKISPCLWSTRQGRIQELKCTKP